MSRLKDIFSNKPEIMSNFIKWAFALPLAYVAYLVLSLVLPNMTFSDNAAIISQALKSATLVLCVMFSVKWFVRFDTHKILSESGSFSFAFFAKGFYVMFLALAVTNLCFFFIEPDCFAKNIDGTSVWINRLCSLTLVLIAAFSEELIFRSFIAWFAKTDDDNLCRNTKKVLLYSTVSALLFSIAHFSNPEVDKAAVWSMLFYFIFGFCLMLCFFRTKGIEFGLGVHIANNLFSAWILNYSDSVLPTQSLFISTAAIDVVTVIQAVICLLFCMILCPKKEN